MDAGQHVLCVMEVKLRIYELTPHVRTKGEGIIN